MTNRTMLLTEPSWYLAKAEPRDEAGRPMTFGQFLVLPAARTLLRAGKPVTLGSRAFDLLVVLLRSRGHVVTRDEIVRHVWPSTIVEESNLRFQMAVLRKALGVDRDRIKTVTGRGYLFVGDAEQPAPIDDEGAAMPACHSVVIIEEDRTLRETLQRVLRPFDVRVASFVSVESFLAASRPPSPARLSPCAAG